MKKIILGTVIALLVSIIPLSVIADCPSPCCCDCGYRNIYRVSYFDNFHNWVTVETEAWTAREAAEDLGLRAGYDCFVGHVETSDEPALYWYRVSYFDESHNWVVEYVEALNRDEAALSLGLEAGKDCFVGRAVGYTG